MRQLFHRHGGACGTALGTREVRVVHLVHGGIVFHVNQKHCQIDQMREVRLNLILKVVVSKKNNKKNKKKTIKKNN